MRKRRILLRFILLFIFIFIFIIASSCRGVPPANSVYEEQISYQFQELNNYYSDSPPLPDELKGTRSNDYSFYVNKEIYTLYHLCYGSQDYYNYYYIYNGDLLIKELEATKKKRWRGFLIKDHFLYYCQGKFSKKYISMDVLTGEITYISKTRFEEEYYKLEPPAIHLPETAKFTNEKILHNKNFLGDQLFDFSYNGILYTVESTKYAIGTIPHETLLKKYDSETVYYTKIARLGAATIGHVLYGDDLYYCYGKERFHRNKKQKRVHYAKISLITLEVQVITAEEYYEVYESF